MMGQFSKQIKKSTGSRFLLRKMQHYGIMVTSVADGVQSSVVDNVVYLKLCVHLLDCIHGTRWDKSGQSPPHLDFLAAA
jgi:hypothetical protein